MITIIVEISKYLIIILSILYTFLGFNILNPKKSEKKEKLLNVQIAFALIVHFLCFLTLFLKLNEFKIILFYGAQAIVISIITILYHTIYPKASRLVTNNMCFLLLIGFVFLTRLSFSLAIKQFLIAVAAIVISSIIPYIMKKVPKLSDLGYLYAIAGICLLSTVFIIGSKVYGATNWIIVFGVSLQPSEFVKILFIFFIASLLSQSTSLKQIIITTCIALIHMGILVKENDLGGMAIFFIIFIVMLYVSTRKNMLFLGGLGISAIIGAIAMFFFKAKLAHVFVRVDAWLDPWKYIDTKGYQITQSLFAMGTGGWFGLGLTEGMPTSIPVYESDFIFPAIAEELGVLFALAIILICFNLFICFINIAMRSKKKFLKLLGIGFAICYIFQVFLNIGGVTKFIPSTGVTLPLISYGGSSISSMLIVMGVIQGIYIITNSEGESKKKNRNLKIKSAKKTTTQE